MRALGEDGYRDGEDECNGVGRDGEELGFGGGVAELFDDGWLFILDIVSGVEGRTYQEQR